MRNISAEVTLDVIGDSLEELKLIREQLQNEAQLKEISVYELRLPDGSIPILAVNIAVSNLVLAATNLTVGIYRPGR